MPVSIVSWIAVISTTVLIVLWFFVVHKELRIKRDMVKSASLQVAASRQSFDRERGSAEEETARGILLRSEDIYRQALALYHRSLKMPWNYIPGSLMGFHRIEEETV